MYKTGKDGLIAITGAYQTGGGIAAVNRLVIRALREQGYMLKIHALGERLTKSSNSIAPDLNGRYYGYSNHKVGFSTAVWSDWIKNKYDLVFCDHVNVAAALAPVSKIIARPYIVWAHGMEVFRPRPTIEGKIGLLSAYKVVASSNFTKKQIHDRFPGIHVEACDLCLDPDRFPELPRLDNLYVPIEPIYLTGVDGSSQLLGEKVILFVGRMESQEGYKGQEALLKAFPGINEAFPDSQLVLCGEGDDLPHLQTIAQQFSVEIQRQIFMPGYVSDQLLRRLYQCCYLFAMPSTGEGFGLVYLEAMSFAKPCVGGKQDAGQCVIQDGISGILLDDPHSFLQLTHALKQLLAMPDRTRQMGLTAYHIVRTNYLYPHFYSRFLHAIAN